MDKQATYAYRVFISYSHDDRVIAEAVAKHLESLGAILMWDPTIQPGTAFSDELREMISFAHVFVPILTPGSEKRPWVHQEIGYAMALGTPILPLAFGALPPGMADRVQALRIPELPDGHQPDRIGEVLRDCLTADNLHDAVARHQGAQASISVLCAPYHEDRTLMLIEHLDAVLKHNTSDKKGVKIRHEASFGTLSLPDWPPDAPIWSCRDGANRRSDWLRSRYRRELQLTRRHAEDGGCDLILHPGHLADVSLEEPRDQDADDAQIRECSRRIRLETLVAFIESMPDELCRVVISDKSEANNTLIVGDWFVAETITRSRLHGLRQTIITRHAPTVSERVQRFDTDFAALLKDGGIEPGRSRQMALDELKARLEKGACPPCRRLPPQRCPLPDERAK